MRTRPLHPRFGVEVHDVALTGVTAEDGYWDIRDLFEDHSLLLFREQDLDEEAHHRLTGLFGPVEDRAPEEKAERPTNALVTNLDEKGAAYGADDLRLLQHRANQLWHTDSTFLPVPALANILTARVVPSSGGETQWVSTRAGWRDLPADLKGRLRSAVFRHRYAHSRTQVSQELAAQDLITRWPDTAWRACWPNPANGAEALYIASHAFAVDGMEAAEGAAFLADLIARVTRPEHIYSHRWRPGDVMIWDERATLHRGQPWPYEEERTLFSYLASAGEADGLDDVRPHIVPMPPPILVSGRVVAYATVDASVTYVDREILYVGDRLLGQVPNLAIVRRPAEQDHLLLFCDANWNFLAVVGGYESCDLAKRRAEREYRGLMALWQDYHHDDEEIIDHACRASSCAFCGRSGPEAGRMVEGRGVWICEDCVNNAYEALKT